MCRRGVGLYQLAKVMREEDMLREQIAALEETIKTNSHPILKTKLKSLRKKLNRILG